MRGFISAFNYFIPFDSALTWSASDKNNCSGINEWPSVQNWTIGNETQSDQYLWFSILNVQLPQNSTLKIENTGYEIPFV